MFNEKSNILKTTFRLIILFSLFSINSYSQILNGSFERFDNLPETVGEYNLVKFWGNCNSSVSTPDYYHADGIDGGDLPNTPAAIIQAQNGKAVMGLTVCHEIGSNKREYISTKFTSPLEIGETYTITFQLSNGAVTNSSNAGFGIDKLGLLLSLIEINQNYLDPILETPQYEIEDVFYNREWQKISYKFTATEEYEYITFGVFHNDEDLEFVKYETNATLTYYFVDNFKIRNVSESSPDREDDLNPPTSDETEDTNPLDDFSPYFIPNSFTPNGDGENDLFYPVINTNEEFIFEVFDRWGGLIFTTSKKNEGWDGTFKGTVVNSGVFVWNLRIISSEIVTKAHDENEQSEEVEPEVKQYRGQITLMK